MSALHPTLHSLARRRSLQPSGRLLAGVWLLASACGPGVATPMPEPPTVFDLRQVNLPEVSPATSSVPFIGASGSVPAGASVHVTNLDGAAPPATATADPNGGFNIALQVEPGEELRFEWVQDSRRSAPADARYATGGATLQPSPRFDCLTLSPGLVLDFGAASETSLMLENTCGDSLTLSNARSRLPLTDFALQTALPLELPPTVSAPLIVTFSRAAAGPRENNLLLDVSLAGTTIRYPLTLLAPAAP